MTTITIYRNKKKQCVGFETTGHAGYAPAGEDIVCAAISILVINTINSLEKLTGQHYHVEQDQESGQIVFSLEDGCSKDAELLLNAMILGLRSLAEDEDYNQYIDLSFEEV